MLGRYRNRLAVLVGSAVLMGVSVSPVAADSSNPCPAGKVPYFSSPSIYLGREGSTDIWSSNVAVSAFCLHTGDPTSMGTPLSGVTVTGVTLLSNGAVPGLQARIVGGGDFQDVPLLGTSTGVTLPTPAGVVTNSSGLATFTFEARSLVHPDLALSDGGTQWVGLDLELGTGMGTTTDGPTSPTPLGGGLVFAETPEMDSVFLFGSGVAGLASYVLLRARARRRD